MKEIQRKKNDKNFCRFESFWAKMEFRLIRSLCLYHPRKFHKLHNETEDIRMDNLFPFN